MLSLVKMILMSNYLDWIYCGNAKKINAEFKWMNIYSRWIAVLSRMKWSKICILSVIVTLIDLFPNWRIRTVWFLNHLSDKMVVRSIENICFCLASFIRSKVRRTKKSLQPLPKDLIKLAKMTENILLYSKYLLAFFTMYDMHCMRPNLHLVSTVMEWWVMTAWGGWLGKVCA